MSAFTDDDGNAVRVACGAEASKLGEGRTSAYVIAASEIERIQQAS